MSLCSALSLTLPLCRAVFQPVTGQSRPSIELASVLQRISDAHVHPFRSNACPNEGKSNSGGSRGGGGGGGRGGGGGGGGGANDGQSDPEQLPDEVVDS